MTVRDGYVCERDSTCKSVPGCVHLIHCGQSRKAPEVIGWSGSPLEGPGHPKALGRVTHSGCLLPERRSRLWWEVAEVGLGDGVPAQKAHFLGFLGEISRGVPGAGISMGNISTHSSRRP